MASPPAPLSTPPLDSILIIQSIAVSGADTTFISNESVPVSSDALTLRGASLPPTAERVENPCTVSPLATTVN